MLELSLTFSRAVGREMCEGEERVREILVPLLSLADD